ncbi:MAG: hypothetical protein QNJ53_03955 [Pleurocapsa sp. MO_192.B19]|nr:hypothetical protein [Pleurocapsa sp. MO_192.B19]
MTTPFTLSGTTAEEQLVEFCFKLEQNYRGLAEANSPASGFYANRITVEPDLQSKEVSIRLRLDIEIAENAPQICFKGIPPRIDGISIGSG